MDEPALEKPRRSLPHHLSAFNVSHIFKLTNKIGGDYPADDRVAEMTR
jgi:hypothetical protein